MGLLIQLTCDLAHPHADGGLDGVACEHSRTATFDRATETCEDLFRCFREDGWHIAADQGSGKPDHVFCPAHRVALGLSLPERHALTGVPKQRSVLRAHRIKPKPKETNDA